MKPSPFEFYHRHLDPMAMPVTIHALVAASLVGLAAARAAAPFDAAPFAHPLPEGNGIYWDDPREIHRVVVHFKSRPPETRHLRLEYWGSKWPEQHLPKDEPSGSGGAGWIELGNWYRGGWRAADVSAQSKENEVAFTFHPVNATEFPKLKKYAANFRYTLKLRVTSNDALPAIDRIEAFTDSTVVQRTAVILFSNAPPNTAITVFNGALSQRQETSDRRLELTVTATENSDPNTFDATLVTVSNASVRFTFSMRDLHSGEPLFLREFGVAVVGKSDVRNYAAIAAAHAARNEKSLYDRVAEMPEQSWEAAWNGFPKKKTPMYLPLGWDGGRQRFRLNPDGSIAFRSNDQYLKRRPGIDTPRLQFESANRHLRFNLPGDLTERSIEGGCLPICRSVWDDAGIRVEQTAFVTPLNGSSATGLPPSDEAAVFMAQFKFTNPTNASREARFRMKYDDSPHPLRVDTQGFLWLGTNCHGAITASGTPALNGETLRWNWNLDPGQSKTLLVKFAYVVLPRDAERTALAKLAFEREHEAVASYWRRRIDEGARLTTPEPMLNELYRAFAGHQLINCEREPGAARRFARVGSFGYGAYGNESCMMVIDLERRGYHREAQECLDGWLHYQGTAGLPGDFSTGEGVLYGAGGYEAGGYNQHHGWILWCLAEHFRYTRDTNWLSGAAPGIIKGADWIIGQCERTKSRNDLSRGLLPSGTLEDIGDWWTWLSTSCYTWRGLDNAAWALEQLRHPDASRIRAEATRYHATMLAAFRAAAERSPVVRLRNGTAVPHIPSYVERRGRSFGWICETLEGALHLLITHALPANSREAEWILRDYEDNLYLSASYGYTLPDFDRYWFSRGGISMQACLLLEPEPFLDRDDVKQALRATFNAMAISYFPDVHMNSEHVKGDMEGWMGDHYKTSDEANATGWLRQLFVREQDNDLLIGQAIPRGWLADGKHCAIERTGTWFGPASVSYSARKDQITAVLAAPTRNPAERVRVRFREPAGRKIASVSVNGRAWTDFETDWVNLPGTIGRAEVVATFAPDGK